MAYLPSLNSYGPIGSVGLRTPVLSALYTGTAASITQSLNIPVPGPWTFNPDNSVIPPDVNTAKLFDTTAMVVTIPYDGIYQLTMCFRFSDSVLAGTAGHAGYWKVLQSKLAPGITKIGLNGSSYVVLSEHTGFFRAGDQLQPTVYATGNGVSFTVTDLSPYISITLLMPSINYSVAAAQSAGAVIIS